LAKRVSGVSNGTAEGGPGRRDSGQAFGSKGFAEFLGAELEKWMLEIRGFENRKEEAGGRASV
jgi:hypothetical protein